MTDYEELYAQMKSCTACPLCTTRNEVVVGRGNPNANLLLIGEAPGAVEDVDGRPFVGPAGKLLDDLILDCGISDDETYFINVLKCRPPANKFPGDDGSQFDGDLVRSCLPWLDQQIEMVDPKVIVLVGRKAADWTIYRDRQPAPSMSRIAFKWIKSELYPRKDMFIIYHPAYLLRLREHSPSRARELEDGTSDTLNNAIEMVRGTIPAKIKPTMVRKNEEAPSQQRLF